MRRLLLPLLLLLPGCATSGGAGDLLGMPAIRTVTTGSVSGGGESVGSTTLRYEEQPVLVQDVVAAGEDEALLALVDALRAEGIPPDHADPEAGTVSLSRAEWAGGHNGRRLSDLLDCGLSSTGRPAVDAARVVVTLGARVSAAGPGAARVELQMVASAYPFGSAGESVRACVTTGELERAVLARTREAVAPAADVTDSTHAMAAMAAPPPATASGLEAPGALPADLPLVGGEQLRVWLGPGERITGAFLQLRPDTLLIATGRRTTVPLQTVQRLQVRRTRRGAMVVSAVVGVAAGVTLATTTSLGIHGQHGIQGRKLNPGLGALAGGVAGLLVAHRTFGSSWVDVPLGALRSR